MGTVYESPRKARKDTKAYTCEQTKTLPSGERLCCRKVFLFRAFCAFRGPQLLFLGLVGRIVEKRSWERFAEGAGQKS